MTISERVFRSTSVLGSRGRALWCSCSQGPAGSALAAPFPAGPVCAQAGSCCSNAPSPRSEAVCGGRTQKWGWVWLGSTQVPMYGGSPHVLSWDTHRDPWKAESPTFRVLCAWQMAEEHSTYLSPFPQSNTLTIKNEQACSNSGKFLCNGKCNSMQVNAG